MIRLLVIEHVQNAIQSLKSTRMRTLLTTLGVAIGVASITTILSLSNGVTSVISRQVDALGGNIAVVRPGSASKARSTFPSSITQQSYDTSTLSEEDINDIAKLPDVDGVAPVMLIGGTLHANKTSVQNGTILATSPSFASVTNLTVRDGQFIDTVTNRDTAVIGPQQIGRAHV